MADIRINSLPTTASASSSDDFLALDGATNGTRKLNAYSPTFGGNLTVSGTGTFGGVTTINASGNVNGLLTAGAASGFDAANTVNIAGSKAGISIHNSVAGSSNNWSTIRNTATVSQSNLVFTVGAGDSLTLNHDKSATLAGNLTVSGSAASTIEGTLGLNCTPVSWYDNANSGTALQVGTGAGVYSFNDGSGNAQLRIYTNGYLDSAAAEKRLTAGEVFLFETIAGEFHWKYAGSGAGGSTVTLGRVMTLFGPTGNLLVGSGTSDGGQKLQVNGNAYLSGKLELATHTTSAGGIGFGTDISLFRGGSGTIRLSSTTAGAAFRLINSVGTTGLAIEFDNNTGYVWNYQNASLLFGTNNTTALTLDSSQNATFAGTVTVNSAEVEIKSSATSLLRLTSTGASGKVWLAQSYSDGSFYITHQGVKDAIRCYPTTGNVDIGGALAINNTVQTAVSVASTHKVTISIGGSTYYLLATNV